MEQETTKLTVDGEEPSAHDDKAEAPGETRKAKLFMHGRSQAVRLPKEFRLPGKEVRVTRLGDGVLLEPLKFDLDAWFARLDALGDEPFLPEGIDDPPIVADEKIFDE